MMMMMMMMMLNNLYTWRCCFDVQSSGSTDNLAGLISKLHDQQIIVNMFSTYAKTSSKRIIGISGDEKAITKNSGYSGDKDLPNVSTGTNLSSYKTARTL